jgi:hypothetical protein
MLHRIKEIVRKNSFLLGACRLAKKILTPFRIAFYRIFMFLFRPEIVEKKFRVSVCAIFKNESLYLREWIEFHKIVGVEHFYLYNNNSTDDFMSVLAPYIADGTVTLTEWKFNQAQMECYWDAIEKFSAETKWLGFIDLDEFVVPKSTDTIYEFLQKFEKKCGSVLINWRVFGSSGKISRSENSLVTEDFVLGWRSFHVCKCFLNTAYGFNPKLEHSADMHFLWTNLKGINVPPMDAFGKMHLLSPKTIETKSKNLPIQINHYFTKSFDEYCAIKSARGDAYYKKNPKTTEYFFAHDKPATFPDYSAYKYLVKLKLALARSESPKVE